MEISTEEMEWFSSSKTPIMIEHCENAATNLGSIEFQDVRYECQLAESNDVNLLTAGSSI
jgi:hypothetical protein